MKMKTFTIVLNGRSYTVGVCGTGTMECMTLSTTQAAATSESSAGASSGSTSGGSRSASRSAASSSAGGGMGNALESAAATLRTSWSKAERELEGINEATRRALRSAIGAYVASKHPKMELHGDLQLFLTVRRGKPTLVVGMEAHKHGAKPRSGHGGPLAALPSPRDKVQSRGLAR